MNPFFLLLLALFVFFVYYVSLNQEVSVNLGKYRFNIKEERLTDVTLGVKLFASPKNMGLYFFKRKYVFWFECL